MRTKEITRHGAATVPIIDRRSMLREDVKMMHSAITRAAAATRRQINPSTLVTSVARRWRSARDLGLPAQARLYALLSPRNWEMMTPAFDSLMALCESALSRPFATGTGRNLTRDETMLIGLLDGSVPQGDCIDCPAGTARAFDSAIRSTRIMMVLVMSGPVGTQP
ncbi:hypothetical protein [Novosphingobium sp. P6W]|uniref:hypothetical protein n=1 Tax=Novosphingobium sp. P6W TaxID=1609758 RepID=UPI0005C2BA7D|nr:hypothetical protein [Novosphingobium sp. P6W]AXB76030.1 hypothetical protein TQ38_005435 [Novosphingobium sp. P6W]KIS31217.1 hypothetical protein TQ38_18370 [Novosphingobium sp. P6W]